MKSNKNLKYILFYMVIVLSFIAAGNAFAQHEGGLGQKKVHLNIADMDQLMKIDGMTADLAKAIVEYREKSGFFKMPEDLLKVQGLTKEIFEKLAPKVGTEGDLYCVPKDDTDDEFDEDEEPVLSPSKC